MAPTVALGDGLTVSAMGFGAMVLMAHAVVAIAQGELETRRTQTPRQRLGIADTHRARRHPIGERGAWQ